MIAPLLSGINDHTLRFKYCKKHLRKTDIPITTVPQKNSGLGTLGINSISIIFDDNEENHGDISRKTHPINSPHMSLFKQATLFWPTAEQRTGSNLLIEKEKTGGSVNEPFRFCP